MLIIFFPHFKYLPKFPVYRCSVLRTWHFRERPKSAFNIIPIMSSWYLPGVCAFIMPAFEAKLALSNKYKPKERSCYLWASSKFLLHVFTIIVNSVCHRICRNHIKETFSMQWNCRFPPHLVQNHLQRIAIQPPFTNKSMLTFAVMQFHTEIFLRVSSYWTSSRCSPHNSRTSSTSRTEWDRMRHNKDRKKKRRKAGRQ